MRTTIIYLLCIFLSTIYSCSSELDLPVLGDGQSTDFKTCENEEFNLKTLHDLAKENGYSSFTLDLSRPITSDDVKFYRTLMDKKIQTRGVYESHLHISEVYYKGGRYTLRLDYSRNNKTGDIKEAYGGVYGSTPAHNSYVASIHTLFSRPQFINNEGFDLAIRAYYLLSHYPGHTDVYSQRLRIVIQASLNANTNKVDCRFYEEGEGEWPIIP